MSAPANVQEARAANGTADEARTRCDHVWFTQAIPLVVGGVMLSDGSEYRRTHSCNTVLDVGDGEHHWGLHSCADRDCDEATSTDVYDPDTACGNSR